MALQSDSQGFLVGDPIDISKVVDQLRRIRSDVSEIKRALLGATSNNSDSHNARSSSGGSNPRVRSERESGAATPNRPRSSNSSGGELPPVNPNGTATPNGRGRDASGRFSVNESSGNQAPNPTDTPDEDPEDKKKKKDQSSFLSNVANRIATAVKESTNGVEEADPTIKAFQEVAEPMRRGYEIFTGGGDKKERWFKKIFKELKLFRKEESVFNRAANQSLDNIEANAETGGGGNSDGGGGGLMAMLAGLLGGRAAGAAGGGLLGLAGSGLLGMGKGLLGAGKGLLKRIPLLGMGKGLLGAGKGLLKRIPLLGALIGGVSAASDIYGTETDDSLTRGEKDKRNGKAAGGLAGSIGGAMAGAAAGSLLGPVGTIVGGAIGMFLGDQAGQIIGEKMGEWTTQLRDADIPGKIVGAWEATTSAIKSGWDGALKLMSIAWDKTKETANAANDFVKDKTGVDVKAEVKNAYDNAVNFTADNIIPSLADLANKGADKLKQGAEWAGENTTLGKGAKAVVDSGVFDTTRKQHKSRGKKIDANKAAMIAEMDANGITDPKERAMLMAQVDHESGGFAFTKELGKDSYFDKYDAGTKKGRDLGNTEKGDGLKYKGRGLIQLTGRANYAAAGKDLGLDLINHPELAESPEVAAKTAVWFWKKNKLGESAKQGDVKTNRHKVNGGEIGLEDVEKKYGKYLAEANNGEFNNKVEQAPVIASVPDDPTQGGRYKYEKLEGGKVQVIDNQTGVMELASDEQANAYRKQEGKPYLDQIAAINANDMPLYHRLAAGPGNAQVQTASATSPRVPTFAPPSPIAEAPPLIQPLASDSNRSMTVNMPTPDVGQDVRDRGIAHIVTGGMSGRG